MRSQEEEVHSELVGAAYFQNLIKDLADTKEKFARKIKLLKKHFFLFLFSVLQKAFFPLSLVPMFFSNPLLSLN